ncbi:pyrroline-5-carboxylate reductase [Eubacteriales bacterium OttesenSCG-928-K08]|nr:pyrroline-5-carboxylate reductase [Eubacteriales bacterium OttesenSCG-928-K08]
MKKLGFLGMGNMGEALLKGILANDCLSNDDILFLAKRPERIEQIEHKYSISSARDSIDLAQSCEMLLLAVKPDVCINILLECADALAGKALISVIAGWSKEDYEALVPDCRVLCVMPNTPVMVGEGMTVFNTNHSFTDEEYAFARQIFASVGKVAQLPQNKMAAVTGVSGSGPAYVYLFIEALADGGVFEGLPRELAYELASQTVLGAAKMVMETKKHPGALKDAVCSPGGTTIEAVSALEHAGFRAAVLDAVSACTKKAKQMAQK